MHRPLELLEVVLILLFAVMAVPAGAVTLTAESVATGFSLLSYGAAAPGDSGSLYVSERKNARLLRLNLATQQREIILDLPNPVQGTETGVNCFAFHPDFDSNGKVYVHYTGTEDKAIRIYEYTLSSTNPSVFDPATQREIITIPNPTGSHNGGWIGFGPEDGLLHLTTGDGGNVPPQETKGLHAQNLDRLEGKVLRLDVDADDFPADDTKNYGVPADNPFASGGGAGEVFAYGLRHPYRAGFDSETGDLYIGDVGSRYREEVNFLPAGSDGGQNYGWRAREGTIDNPDFSDPAPSNAIDPIHEYLQGVGGFAIIGGFVYHGDNIPWLDGSYIFGDFVQNTTLTLSYDGDSLTSLWDHTASVQAGVGGPGQVTAYAEGPDGEIYQIHQQGGLVSRIVDFQGDFNGDGSVDAADYTVWRDTLGDTGMGLAADANGDRVVDSLDYQLWRGAFGNALPGAASVAGTQSTAPEPGAGGLLLACCLAGLAARRRHPA